MIPYGESLCRHSKIFQIYITTLILTQPKEFVMQIDTNTLQRMFTSVIAGRPIGHVNGFVIQHESYFNGHETRYSLRCTEPALGNKLAWQVWSIPNRKPTAEDIKLTCKNRSFDSSQLQQHDGMWFFDPNGLIEHSPILNHGTGFASGIVGGMYQQPHVNQSHHGGLQFGQPGFIPNPGINPQFAPPINPFFQQPRMDQVSTARSGTFSYDPKMVAKQLRGSLLSAEGQVEVNRLAQAFNRELVTKDKWVINEDSNELVNTFYGDPKFSSAADRILAFKILWDLPATQGFIVVTSNIEEFTITVRMP